MNITNENSGLIFKNDRKENANHPDYKGSVNIKGVQMDIALWVNQNERGKFMSAKFSEPYEKSFADNAKNETENKTTKQDASDEEVPF